jgi:hypothetical protein
MEFNENSITITDETIVSFYKTNTNLDIVSMNHIFIEILKNLSTNLSSTINSTMNSKILSLVTDIHSNLSSIKSDIVIKLHESKKDYIEDIKTLLSNNSLTNNEKLNSLIEKNNDTLLTKTTLIVNDVIPKSQDKNYLQIENCIKSFCNTITQDTTKLLELTNKDDVKIKSIVDNIDNQFNKMISTIQQPIFTFIQSSEERTNNGIQQVREHLSLQQQNQQKLTNELNDFLNKYKNNSSSKGNVSEAELYFIIQSIMPSDEIIKVGTDTATCDFKVNRIDKNKPTILFENKDYSRSVTTEEIKKFERDLQIQKNHGIFVSQKSPITFKQNFQIDIINGLIHIYIPNAEYDANKIKVAVDIIDNLSSKLQSISNSNEDDYSISKEDMEDIIEEYRVFVSQKLQMIETIKSINKQLLDKMEEIQLPKLKKLFIKIGNIENDNDFKCKFCNTWSGKNKASLAAHVRNCKLNPKNDEALIEPPVISDLEINISPPPIPVQSTINPTIESLSTNTSLREKSNRKAKK